MNGIRVYEAARKLNIDTSKLMKILAKEGVKIKSPISFISQSDFEKTLSMLTSSQKTAKKTGGLKITGKQKQEKDFTKLSLVAPAAGKAATGKTATGKPVSDKISNESEAEVIPIGKLVKEEQKEAEKPVETEKQAKTRKPPKIKPEPKPKKNGRSLIYLALGMAAAALLAIFLINSDMKSSLANLSESVESNSALSANVATLTDGVRVNENMIVQNQSALADLSGEVNAMKHAQARLDLQKRSKALEELSSTLTGDMPLRIQKLSQELGRLASSL